MRRRISRGDIFRLSLVGGRGHEQRGPRYGVVVQDDDYNDFLSTVLVVPTSTAARPASFHVPLTIEGRRTFALVEQLLAVDVEGRLREWIANVAGQTDFRLIEEQLGYLLGLAE